MNLINYLEKWKMSGLNNEKILGWFIYALLTLFMVLIMWGMATLFSSVVSDYEVVNPKPNIECVVVSRMFNTSVDCNWEEK